MGKQIRIEARVYGYAMVGWDPPCRTFFAQVFDPKMGPAWQDDPAQWLGALHDEYPTIEQFESALAQYAELPADVRARLLADQAQEGGRHNPIEDTGIFETLREHMERWSRG